MAPIGKLPYISPDEGSGTSSDDKSSGLSGGVIGACVAAGLVIALFLCCSWYFYRKSKMPRDAPELGMWPSKDLIEDVDGKRQLLVEQEESIRKAEEADKSRGAQIWFSTYVERGNLRHWVIYCRDKKYELRLDGSKFLGRRKIRTIPTTANVAAMLKKREDTRTKTGKPYSDEFLICLLGWTELSDEKLLEINDTCTEEFGEYNLKNKNCQHWLRDFTKRVRPDPAIDYEWFKSGDKTIYYQYMRVGTTSEVAQARQTNFASNRTIQNINMINSIF